MLRTKTVLALVSLGVLAGLVLTGSGTAWAQTDDVYWVAYYSGGAQNSRTPPPVNGAIQIVNPGVNGDICTDIYVFDQFEELKECCTCFVSADGLLSLTIFDVTNNPFTGKFSTTGVIKLLSDPSCSPTNPQPAPEIRAWINNLNNGTVTESEFEPATLSGQELSNLGVQCTAVKNRSGAGICGNGNPACFFN